VAVAGWLGSACGSFSPAASGPGEATKPAATILADSARAVQAVATFKAVGMLDPGVDVDLSVAGDDSSGTITTKGATWHEVTSGGRVFFKGAQLWAASAPTRAAAFGDNWVEVTDPSAGFGLARVLPHFRVALTEVVFGPHPGLVNRGVSTLSGRQVVELRNSHDLYDVLASGTPLPVRWVDEDTATSDGVACALTLGDFESPITVTAPVATATLTPPPSPTAG
jgi:hypothetical protein